MMMNTGKRMAEGISFLKSEITISLIKRTKVILIPIPNPLKILVVTPNDEHKPILKTKSGFSTKNPFVNVFNLLLMVALQII